MKVRFSPDTNTIEKPLMALEVGDLNLSQKKDLAELLALVRCGWPSVTTTVALWEAPKRVASARRRSNSGAALTLVGPHYPQHATNVS